LARGAGWLPPWEAQRILDAIGVLTVSARPVADEDEAIAKASDIGYPVAITAFGPASLHKSDTGAVQLGLADEQAVRAAYRDLRSRLGEQATGVFVWRMASEGDEMFIGGLRDTAFGPVVFCGSGGVLVELFGDAVCRLCPLTDVDATQMLSESRGVARLRGHRGKPVADEAALRDALLRVAALLDACDSRVGYQLNQCPSARCCRARRPIRIAAPTMPAPSRRVRY
jgi:hypothetical protein